jgi:type IV fimbrial biogenesis protein FimT
MVKDDNIQERIALTTHGARSRGYTLLELMVTLAVAGVLLGVGVPGFFDVTRNQRAAANANELVTALSIARSEAIRRRARITVCASSDGATCTGGWNQGWIVVRDSAATDAAAPSIAATTDVLRVWPAPAGNPTVTLTPTGTTWVRFLPRGNARSSGGAMPVTYNMEIQGCARDQGRNISLNTIGRTTVVRDPCP